MKFKFLDDSFPISPPASRREWAWVSGALGALAIFYVMTLRDGHAWGDDFAQYVRHAQNIVEGRGYSETGYIYNPDYADLGPRGYPPGLPLFLAPVVALRGVDFFAMKILMIAAYVAMITVLWRLLRSRTTPVIALSALAVFAANPWNWNFKDTIASEYLYLLWVFSAVLLFDAEKDGESSSDGSSLRYFGIGVFSVLAAITRTTGILLFPAYLAVDWAKRRRIRRSTFVTIVAGVAAYFALSRAFPGTGSYLDQLEFGVVALRYRAEHYLSSGARWFFPEIPSGIAISLAVVVAVGAILGFVAAIRRGWTVCELMVLGHAIAVALWPSHQGTRFLLPLLPFAVEYVIRAAALLAHGREIVRDKIAVATAVLLFAGAASGYAPQSITLYHESYDTAEWRDLKDFVARSTAKDAVFLFKKPRLFALETERRCGTFEPRGDAKKQWAFADEIGAEYFVRSAAPTPEYARFRASSPERLHTIFSNRSFVVEKISSRAGR